MRNFILLTIFLSGCLFSCQKKDPDITDCIADKIESFKQEPWAERIVKVERPQGPVFWFKDSYIDSGEPVMDQNCTVLCLRDCECIGDVYCEPGFWDFPSEIIWQK